MDVTPPIQISVAQLGDELSKAIQSGKSKPQPVIVVSETPVRVKSQMDSYVVVTSNTVEYPFLRKSGVLFNKLWIYPGVRTSGTGILAANVQNIYIGERGDGPELCPDLLSPGDLPFKIELPEGIVKSLDELLVYGTAGDGIWIKYWPLT